MSCNKFLKEIIKDNNSYFLYVTISGQEFDITISDGSSVWCGTIDSSTVAEAASRLNMTIADFIDIIKQSCTNTKSNVITELCEKDENLVVKFKKVVDHEINVRIQLCSVLLVLTSNAKDHLQNILRFSVNQLNSTSEYLARVENDLSARKQELSDVLNKLDSFVADKVEMEQKLFAYFALVLNEKKRRIEMLEDEANVVRSQNVGSSNIPRNDTDSD